jgi:NADH-quinone oxidoreductase subunit K
MRSNTDATEDAARRRFAAAGARDDFGDEALTMLGPTVAAYLIVSAILFATGTVGVLVRRSPLIVLLALEIMLNAGNLALIAFARQTGNGAGQIFALTVMIVAAAEVVVGLGLIVAMSRRKVELDVDKLSTLRG